MKTKKILALAIAAVLLVAVGVGGTLAWLTDSTDEVKNTFAPSNINIELKEHNYNAATGKLGDDEVITESDYKMVPGVELPKDPFVRVKAESEPCYVFVEVLKSSNYDTYISSSLDNTWKVVEGVNPKTANATVYVYVGANGTAPAIVNALNSEQKLNILAGEKVTVNDVTKAQMDVLYNTDGYVKNDALPTISFFGYAVQSAQTATDAVSLWNLINPPTT